ncbi:MAG: branched-chain amino acid aminotransferase [Flavobacteriales bacterium]
MISTADIQIQRIDKSRITEVDFNNLPFGRVFSDHMFCVDFADGKWQNAKIIPYQNLYLSPAVSVIHYGQTIFEGMKAYRSASGEINLFRPEANAARFNQSAHRMCMPEIPEDLFIEGLKQLLQVDSEWVPRQDGCSLYIRPFMFATDEYIGIRPSDNYKFIIFTCPVGAYYSEPLKVSLEMEYARAIKGGTGEAKAGGNYAAALYPAKLKQAKGYHQLVWTDAAEHKYIEESGTMNLFFQIDDTLVTPLPEGSILKGITRDSLMVLAKDMGLKLEERRVSVEEVKNAFEQGRMKDAFGAGTAATIAHIHIFNIGDKDYQLPPMEERTLSNKLRDRLNAIRTGTAEDQFGWIVKI